MLTYLQIRDFAIIDSIELELQPGLTVLTGETGAGKSIMVDALQIIAGGRAGAEVVRANTERAEITATFDLMRSPREVEAVAGRAVDCHGGRRAFRSTSGGGGWALAGVSQRAGRAGPTAARARETS